MIARKYRLKENEVKKVFKVGKPFFSYGIVLNISENRLLYNRYAIIISAKNVKDNITRNFFRRRFYDKIAEFEENQKINGNICKKNDNNQSGEIKNNKNYDLVFVVKKGVKLDKNNSEDLVNFYKNIDFLLKKI